MRRASRLLRGVRELAASRVAAGPYRFLVRRWDDISDIDLARRVLETEFFKEELAPVPLPVGELRSIVVLAPHQDDETIGAGGTLLLAAAAGVRLEIVYITDGASTTPSFAGREAEYVRLRDEEARIVCDRLGARMHRIGISNVAPRPTVVELSRLSRLLHELAPQVVLAPWILDGPPKHRLVNHLMWLAHVHEPLPDFELWGYQTANTLVPNGYVDITSVADDKRRLLQTFRTQNEHFASYEHMAMGMSAWNQRFVTSVEPRYIETFFTLPVAEVLSLIGRFYPHDLAATYRHHRQAYPGMLELHRTVMGERGTNRSTLRALVHRVRSSLRR